jgi:hypothetical protein
MVSLPERAMPPVMYKKSPMLASACPYLAEGWLPKRLEVLSFHVMEEGDRVYKSFRKPVSQTASLTSIIDCDYKI